MQPLGIAKQAVEYALDKKASEPVIMNLQGLTTITDFFVILSANTGRQVKAIAENIKDMFSEEHDIKCLYKESDDDARWVLLDYGSVVIHVFQQDARMFYDLERLWADAEFIRLA